MGDNCDILDDNVLSGRKTPSMPYTMNIPEQNNSIYNPSRVDALTIPQLWKYAYGENKPEYSKENDKLWEMLNEIAEEERVLRNEIELLKEKQQQQQQQQQQEKLENLEKQQQQQKVMNGEIRDNLCIKSGGKSRRVFRKNTKIMRRSNKKSNRSRSHRRHRRHHHRRRTSHVAKQT